MDQHDLNGMANDVRSLYSHEKLDTSFEAKSLSDCCGTDENTGFENLSFRPNHEINSCKSETLPEMERKCPNYDHVSSSNFTNGDAKNLKPQSPVVSTSRSLMVEVGMHKKENCEEGSSEATSCSIGVSFSAGQNKLAGDGNPKDGEASAQSLEGFDSMQHTSIKSDVSSETGEHLNKENSDLNVGRTKENKLNSGEDGLKSIVQATFHDKQLKTESSSSNSTYVIFPASSNDSCQETSQDAKSCKNSKSSGMNSFICTGFKCSLEEPAVKSIVLGMAAQIAPKSVLESSIFLPGKQGNVGKASKIVENVSTRDSEKMLGMIADQNSVIVKKIDLPKSSLAKKKNAELLNQDKVELSYELDDALEVAWRVAREVEQEVGIYREASGSSSSLERNSETIHLSSIDSGDPNEKNCLTATGHRIKSHKELGKCDSFCFTKEVVDPGTSMKNEHLCLEVKEPSQEMDPTMMQEANDGLHGQESSSLTTKPEDVAANDQNQHFFRFDLNEDIPANEVEYPKESVNETLSYHVVNVATPIAVLAKSGVPTCLPITPLHFEGELGWKGSAATSAFRPASLSKSSNRNNASSTNDITYNSKHSQGIRGIDLNVAAAGDDFAMEMFPKKHVSVPSGFPSGESSVEVSSKRAERLNLDLNRLSENDDNCPQSFPRASLSRHSIGDFDLNDNPSLGDACNDAHWPSQRAQPLRDRAFDDPVVTFVGNARQPESNSVRPAYWADLSCVRGFSHGHAQPFLVAAPNVLPPVEQMQRVIPPQPKLTYTPPPHAFPYNNGFRIGPTDLLSSTVYSPGALPYITDPRGTTVVPQVLGSGTLSTFPGMPHLMEVAGGPIPSDIGIRPRFDLNGGVTSLENGSRGGNARQLFIPVSTSLMEEQMRSFQQVALPATPMKRREPEGGWDSYQLGPRQVTSWR